nr:MAG TPA: Phosphoribosyl-aminoimidazole carboxylase [Caudoviricetes sp.]
MVCFMHIQNVRVYGLLLAPEKIVIDLRKMGHI